MYNSLKIILDSMISGIFTGIGAMFGYMVCGINNYLIALFLSIAAGSMLYIVSAELIPSSKNTSNNRKVYLMYIVGILIGAIITNL